MSNEVEQDFDDHSPAFRQFVDSFPESPRRKAAETFLKFVEKLRELAAKPDHDEVYSHWYNEVRESLSGRGCTEKLVKELEQVVTDHELRHQYIFDVIKGIDREAKTKEFRDFAQLGTCAYLNSSPILVCLAQILGNEKLGNDVETALMDLGVADYLLHKLANFVPQLEEKIFYLAHLEVQDRGLDLYDQVEPIDDELWKDLVQFQCLRILERIQSVRQLAQLPAGRLRRQLKWLAIRTLCLLKKIRRVPTCILREKVVLTRMESFKAEFQKWRSITVPAP